MLGEIKTLKEKIYKQQSINTKNPPQAKGNHQYKLRTQKSKTHQESTRAT